MELGLFGLVSLLGFMLFFEGFSRKNPFMSWAGAIMLMVGGTEVMANGLLLVNGSTITIVNSTTTTTVVNFLAINDFMTQVLARLMFYVGFFGLAFPISDFLLKSKRGEVG